MLRGLSFQRRLSIDVAGCRALPGVWVDAETKAKWALQRV
jgi:hypothetical protein